jgi:hypothetical protein
VVALRFIIKYFSKQVAGKGFFITSFPDHVLKMSQGFCPQTYAGNDGFLRAS